MNKKGIQGVRIGDYCIRVFTGHEGVSRVGVKIPF